MNFKPLYDKVLVKKITSVKEQKTKSGLYIPNSAKEKLQEGIVLALGTGLITESGKEVPLTVQINDKVLFEKHNSRVKEVMIDGEEFLLMREGEILGIMG